jgi:cobalt-zinc-cadmium efflux system protein
MDPVPIRSGLMTGIAVIGRLANLAGLAILSHTHESLNIRGARMHLIGDALSSGGVLLAGVGIAVTGWQRIDPIVGGLIAVVIVVGAARLLRDRFHIVHTTLQIESRAYQELGDLH